MAVLERVSIGSLAQGAVPPGYTFTRSTAALYVDSDGLLKWAAHNLLLRSEEFDNASWTKGAGASVSANTVTAPDGTLTGDSLVASGSPGSVYQTAVGLTPATIYTASAYVKYSNVQWVRFMYYDGGGNQCRVWVDVQNGVIGTGNAAGTGTFTAATIVPAGSGWYRISVTGTQPAVNGLVQFQPVTADASTTPAAGTVYMWGAQLNYGSTATAYLPTTSAARYDSPRRQWDATNRRWGYVGEPSRTNSCTYSQDLSNAVWSKTNVTLTSASTTGPDGLASGWKVEATTTASTAIYNAWTNASTSTVWYCIVKQGSGATSGNLFGIRNTTTATNLAIVSFNYSTGVTTLSSGTATHGAISLGSGWWIVWMSCSAGITSGDALRGWAGQNGSSANAGDFHYFWHAQAEVGATYPTSPIPTTTVAVSRGADLLTRALTAGEGTALSAQGTMVVEFSFLGKVPASGDSDRYAICLDDGTTSNRQGIAGAAAADRVYHITRTAGSNVATPFADVSLAVGTVVRAAARFAANNVNVAANNDLGTTDGTAAMPTLTAISIGSAASSSGPLNGLIYGWTIYDDAKTDAELQALTTPTTNRNQSRLTLGLGLGL